MCKQTIAQYSNCQQQTDAKIIFNVFFKKKKFQHFKHIYVLLTSHSDTDVRHLVSSTRSENSFLCTEFKQEVLEALKPEVLEPEVLGARAPEVLEQEDFLETVALEATGLSKDVFK